MNIENLTNRSINSTKSSTTKIDTLVVDLEISLSILKGFLNIILIVLLSLCLAKRKTFSNIIFLLITICDLTVGLIIIPGDVVLTYTNYYWTNGRIICVFYKMIDFANCNLSLMLILTITIHRYLQLMKPLKQTEEMNRWRWLVILLLFVFNYVTWFTIWYVYLNEEKNKNICYLRSSDIFISVLNFVTAGSPFCLIILINVLIIRAFGQKKTKAKHLSSGKNKKKFTRKDDVAIYRVIAMSVNIMVCWGLYITIWSTYKICRKCVPGVLNTFSFLMYCAIAAINPLIIFFFNRNYRQILFKKCRKTD